MLIAGVGGHVEEVFDVLIVKIVVDEAGMPSNSRRYGRQWAPVFEVFEGSVEVRFMVVVVEAGGEILAWGAGNSSFSRVGDG